MASTDQIKQLREETGISIMDCKKALEETSGNIEEAKELLRKWGKEFASKKTGRDTKQGIVDTYLHSNKKVGVMIQLQSETDFVAKSDEFRKLAHEICLQIAAMSPLYLRKEDIPEEFLKREKEICQEQFKDSGKPQEIVSQIIEGKLNKYAREICLLSQPWVKDDTKTIEDLVRDHINKLGENIVIKKFTRYKI